MDKKEGNKDCDVTMGSFDDTEISELVGLYVLYILSTKYGKYAIFPPTLVSNFVWENKHSNTETNLVWDILDKGRAYKPEAKRCLLCLR